MSYDEEELFDEDAADGDLDEPLEPLDESEDFGFEEDPDKDH